MTTHRESIKKAKEILKQKGFADDEIHENFWFKNYHVDAIGWKPEHKVAVECGYCSPKKKQDLERFFDEVICPPWQHHAEPTMAEPSVSTHDVLAKMRFALIRENDVMFEVPLAKEEWSKEFLEDEIGFLEREFQHFSKLFNAFSHENRLKMMKLLIEDEDSTMGFAEFIRDMGLNPKLVWENTRKLSEGGLLEKDKSGRYRCSEFGEASFIILSFVLKRLRDIFENVEGR